jgi:hypothetical protein
LTAFSSRGGIIWLELHGYNAAWKFGGDL